MKSIRQKGAELLQLAKWEHKPVIVLAGRPYHIDPEVNHGIDRLICDLGAIVLSEDSVCHDIPKFKTGVLNQWTYHARLYSAAKFVAQCDQGPKHQPGTARLLRLRVDAITTDETRSIIEQAGKIYTQIKIDEITNTGTAKIRLRSLFAVQGLSV